MDSRNCCANCQIRSFRRSGTTLSSTLHVRWREIYFDVIQGKTDLSVVVQVSVETINAPPSCTVSSSNCQSSIGSLCASCWLTSPGFASGSTGEDAANHRPSSSKSLPTSSYGRPGNASCICRLDFFPVHTTQKYEKF